jgi:hypothetical protein
MRMLPMVRFLLYKCTFDMPHSHRHSHISLG